jgi:ABC-2 type transport system ATP-binding protein
VGDGAFRKKSGDRMRQILASGVTGLLVSHSVDHVRELCNKILWLDHGKQVIFSDEVDFCCDAYEEFLRCRQLPASREDMEKLAQGHREHMDATREEKELQQEKEIKQILTGEDRWKYVDEAQAVLEQYRPEALAAGGKRRRPAYPDD